MIIKVHLNLAGMAGANPLIGENEQRYMYMYSTCIAHGYTDLFTNTHTHTHSFRFGSRFTSMSTGSAYDKELRKIAFSAAKKLPSLEKECTFI